MDTKLAIKPRMIGIKFLSTAVFSSVTPFMSMAIGVLPLISHSVSAEEFLCDATQASSSELPVLDKACPIGKGLWGNQKPKGAKSSFWIQCGVLSKPLSLTKAKNLYQHISTDVWSKPEDKGHRCLIGPYDDFTKARQELSKVKTERAYKEAFIREVVKHSEAGNSKPTSNMETPAATEKNNVAAVNPSKKPVAVVATTMVATPSKSDMSSSEKVVVRLKATVEGIEYRVPYSHFEDGQFYMEHGLPWNRLSYTSATEMCDSMAMRLPLEQEWKQLLDAKVMQGDNWPLHLPYWGYERKGMFTSGKISQLKGTSLLNVLCVR